MRTLSSTLLTATLILGNCLGAQERPSSAEREPSRILHVSFSALDQWTQCIHDVTGKFLLLARFQSSSGLSCPSSSADFSKRMNDKSVLIPGDQWDLIIGKGVTPLDTPAEFAPTLPIRTGTAIERRFEGNSALLRSGAAGNNEEKWSRHHS